MLVEGKIALITGGAQGIGRAIAEELLRHGAKVCLVDILKNELSQTESELKKDFGDGSVITSVADVTKEQQLTASFEQTVLKFGRLDIVVNNAGIFNEKLWETMLSINLGGVIRGTLLAMKFMSPETGGVVVNISSDAGVDVTSSISNILPVYSTAKAGVIAYTRCFASNKDLVAKNIRLLSLCPTLTETKLARGIGPDSCWDVDALRSMMTVYMKPSEVAEICHQLIKDDTKSGSVALIEGANRYKFV